MKLLSLEHLLELHVLVIAETGGAQGLRDLGRLESVVAVQTQAVFGEELYQSLHEKAAAIIRGVIADHPFVDGNKRSAMLAGLTFLQINGLAYTAKSGELEDFAVQVAVEHLDVAAIARWLEEYTKEGKYED